MHAEGSLPRSPDESDARAAALVRIYGLLRLAAVVTAVTKPDGSLESARVGVGRDGFVPN